MAGRETLLVETPKPRYLVCRDACPTTVHRRNGLMVNRTRPPCFNLTLASSSRSLNNFDGPGGHTVMSQSHKYMVLTYKK